MLEDLKGKRALVTGSSTGIGAALALELGKLGVAVAVHGNRSLDQAQKIVDTITKAGGKAVLVSGDVSDSKVAAKIAEDAAEALGGLDILVNNAGSLIERVTNAAFDDELYEQIYDLNVRSIFSVTKAALVHLKKSGSGVVINTGSIAARHGGAPGSVIYASAKAAVHSISRNMAREFAPFNIRVNTVAPGVITTPFHDATPRENLEAAKASVALGRLGTAEECVGAYVFLASETMSAYVTGQIIDVNGGQFMA